MAKYVEHFVVESRFPFPVDMLRYDMCYPSDTESANAISASLNPELSHALPKGEKFRVTLTATTKTFIPNTARWESMMWRITDINGQPAGAYGNECFNWSSDRTATLGALAARFKETTGSEFHEVWYRNGQRETADW